MLNKCCQYHHYILFLVSYYYDYILKFNIMFISAYCHVPALRMANEKWIASYFGVKDTRSPVLSSRPAVARMIDDLGSWWTCRRFEESDDDDDDDDNIECRFDDYDDDDDDDDDVEKFHNDGDNDVAGLMKFPSNDWSRPVVVMTTTITRAPSIHGNNRYPSIAWQPIGRAAMPIK